MRKAFGILLLIVALIFVFSILGNLMRIHTAMVASPSDGLGEDYLTHRIGSLALGVIVVIISGKSGLALLRSKKEEDPSTPDQQ